MKKSILVFLVPFLLFMAADAQAQDTNFYAKIFSGANFLQNRNATTYKSGYILAGSLGYCWNCGFCLEAEYAYRRNGINKIHFFSEGSSKHGHVQTSSYMANILWNVPFASCRNLQPLIGAGIGYDFQQMHSSNSRIVFNQKWHQFSWQLMAGLAYSIFCNTDITLEYKFHQGGCRFYNHSIGAGLAYYFGPLW